MAERRLFLDEGPGETRAVVTLDGAAERLLIERPGETYPRLGARHVARVRRIERASGLALLDLGDGGGRDAKRAAREATLQAIGEAARLLRLKAQGGLVVIDLVGRGHDGTALIQAVQAAFAGEQPGLVIGPVTRFGTLELAIPRR